MTSSAFASAVLPLLLLLAAAAGSAAQAQPAHFGGRRSAGGSRGSNAIAGVWQAFFGNGTTPFARLTAIVQGDAVALIGVFTADNSPITGTGWYVSPQRPGYKSPGYAKYQVYYGTTQPWGGWFTLVALDADTILPFAGEDPDIPSPLVQQDRVWRRVK